MPKKENSARLGKGLSAIFGEDVGNVLEDIQQGKTEVHEDSKFEVEVKDVKPNPYQPRKNFDDDKIQELADSIKLHGVFTPILVKKAVKGYELIAGERRLRASKVAGLKTIPAILMEFDDQQMMEIALLENIQREDLNAIEEAQGYEKLIKKLGYTQEELAKRIGKSREHVANMLRLLKLPKSVQQYVIDKQLSMGHVRALLGLKDASQIEDVAKKAIQLHLSVRAVETLVKNMNEPKSAPEKKQRDINLDKVQDRLQSRFQTRVRIDEKQITIRYDGNEDLNRHAGNAGLALRKNKEKTKANCFDFILGSIKNEIRKKSRLFQMLLSRLWVNIKQGECNTIVFINRSCILPFAYTLKKEPFKLLDFFIYEPFYADEVLFCIFYFRMNYVYYKQSLFIQIIRHVSCHLSLYMLY
mgnify:CR=1 FL=1